MVHALELRAARQAAIPQVLPMESINLHSGDIRRIGTAHNLLSAMIDNHIQQGNALNIDPRRIVWRRVMDMNDRALSGNRHRDSGTTHGVPRETGYDITVASEVMAIFCLAGNGLDDLKARLGGIVVAYIRRQAGHGKYYQGTWRNDGAAS